MNGADFIGCEIASLREVRLKIKAYATEKKLVMKRKSGHILTKCDRVFHRILKQDQIWTYRIRADKTGIVPTESEHFSLQSKMECVRKESVYRQMEFESAQKFDAFARMMTSMDGRCCKPSLLLTTFLGCAPITLERALLAMFKYLRLKGYSCKPSTKLSGNKNLSDLCRKKENITVSDVIRNKLENLDLLPNQEKRV